MHTQIDINKKYFYKVQIFVSIILLVTGCSVGKLKITGQKHPLISIKEISQEEISVRAIRKALNDGQHNVAQNLLELLNIGKDNVFEAHLYKGILLHRQNRLSEACKEFETCCRLINPSIGDSLKKELYKNIAHTYYNLNNFKKAANYRRSFNKLAGDENDEGFITFLESFKGEPYQIEYPKRNTALNLKLKWGIPFVKGSFNSSETMNILIDTGANINIISSKMADKLGIQTIATGGKGKGVGGMFAFDYGVIDSLRLGNIVIRNIPVTIIDSKKMTFKWFGLIPLVKIDVVIGTPLLKQFDVTFDYKKRKFNLSVPRKKVHSSFDGNFCLVNNLIFIPVEVNEVEGLTFMLDTGGNNFAAITDNGLEELKSQRLKTSKSYTRRGHGVGGTVKYNSIKDVTLQIYDYSIQNVNMSIRKTGLTNPIYDGSINNKLLRNFRLKINFVSMRLALERY
ncbi:MAG: hypothetical protein HOC71_06360 [Candidatus Latescibacteria bacterium]|jgi:predicted aspartyl protease|nr:hypothetical protein [Candidatus Latescibacterota bacterium]